ncbi:hypothetical protein Bca4012_016275 [Brassica carinata]
MVEVGELEPLSEAEEEEDISYDDLKRRMWKDRKLMEKLKQQKRQSNLASHQAEASRRKKMARSQDSVLKYMMKIMEVCKAKGFVYGIVPEKETGTWSRVLNQEEALLNIKDLKISEDQEASGSKTTKRKGDFMEPSKRVYTCQNSSCPKSDASFGFMDKNSRTGHEIQCLNRFVTQEPSQITGDMFSMLVTSTNTTSEDDNSRMQHEFNSSRRFDDEDDTAIVLNQSPESNQSDNVGQSTFSVWDMGCEEKDIYMFDY